MREQNLTQKIQNNLRGTVSKTEKIQGQRHNTTKQGRSIIQPKKKNKDARSIPHTCSHSTVVGHHWQAIMANSLAVKSLFTAQSSVNSGSPTQTRIVHVGF